jgi:hypothetical protein
MVNGLAGSGPSAKIEGLKKIRKEQLHPNPSPFFHPPSARDFTVAILGEL